MSTTGGNTGTRNRGRFVGCGFMAFFAWAAIATAVASDDQILWALMVLPVAGLLIVGATVVWALGMRDARATLDAAAGSSVGLAQADGGPTAAELFADLGADPDTGGRYSGWLLWVRRYLGINSAITGAIIVLIIVSIPAFFWGPDWAFPVAMGGVMLCLAALLVQLALGWERMFEGGVGMLEALGLDALGDGTTYCGVRSGRAITVQQSPDVLVTAIEEASPEFAVASQQGRFPGDGLPALVAATLRREPQGPWWDGVEVSGGPDGITVTRAGLRESRGALLDLRLAERLALACDA